MCFTKGELDYFDPLAECGIINPFNLRNTPMNVRIVGGSSISGDYTDGTYVGAAKRIFCHPKYKDDEWEFDIAIIVVIIL